MEQLTSLRVDSPASHTALAESAKDGQTSEVYGMSLSASCPLQGRLGSLVKMLLASPRWTSTICAMRWSKKTTKRNRCLYQLAPLARRTSGSVAGFWPTYAPGTHGRGWSPLRAQVEAMARGEKPRCQVLTVDMVMLSEMKRTGMTFDQIKTAGGSLSAEWVESFMGYDTGHTDLGDSGTPFSRKSRRRSSGP